MKIAIVEDEGVFLDKLIAMLREWESKRSKLEIFSFLCGEDFLRAFHAQQVEYDVVFLDIKLGGITGMDVAKEIRKGGFDGSIVFSTNHDEFALAGYDVFAMQYLIKPIEYEAVASCMELIDQKAAFSYHYKGEHTSVLYKNILYFESAQHYIMIHILGNLGTAPFKQNLSDVAENLPKQFVQCHRSFVVNMTHVMKLKDKKLFLRDHSTIPVGNYYLEKIIEAFKQSF